MSEESETVRKERALKYLLWLAMISICMLFAGLTSGYIVRRETGTWLKFELPFTFWISTSVIILSSVTMNWAVSQAKTIHNSQFTIHNLRRGLLLTLLLGLCFALFQFLSWKMLVKENIYFTGVGSNASGSYLYVITLLHLCHILGGLVALAVVYFKTFRVDKADHHLRIPVFGIKQTAVYWHFLDGLWVYLFVFLLLIR